MNLIIDVGNTRTKLAVFKDSKMVHFEIFNQNNLYQKVENCVKKFNCNHAIISFVGAIEKDETDKIKECIRLIELTNTTNVPFKNCYKSPKTLGVDRIALVAAAFEQFPNKNVLIIDAGTCITYDFIDNKGRYHGGAISPGISMRYKAVHTFTDKLPKLTPVFLDKLIGDTTENSLHIGILGGVISEIDSFIDKYRKKNMELTVVLTGGDANFLANRLKNSIFANPKFLLQGLNTILTYNLK